MYFNERFALSALEMHRLGVFNPLMEHDNELFIDPKLLDQGGPEFADARAAMHAYFADTVDLIRLSSKRGDLSWNAAVKRTMAKEKASAGMGYSKSGRSGNGIGKTLASQIVARAAEILPLVNFKSNIFELVGVFAERVGCDRLSDMVISILASRFYAYTERVAFELGIYQLTSIEAGAATFKIPCFSEKDGPVLLLPKAILKPLPIAADIGEALAVADLNEKTRTEFNAMWEIAEKKGRPPGKKSMQQFIFSRPDIYEGLLNGYEKAESEAYDFDKDPRRLADVEAVAREIVGKKHEPGNGLSPQDRVNAVLDNLLTDLRKLIQENRLSDLLFNDDGSPRKEVLSQRLVYAVASIYGRLYDVDITREPNAGNGPADFKFSLGQSGRLLIEVKLSTNQRIRDAYYHQLPAYAASEGIKRLVLLVIQVDDREVDLEAFAGAELPGGHEGIQVEVIDARRKLSASKRTDTTQAK
jgi:hypothetical protein